MFKKIFDKVSSWFKDSLTIFAARMTVLAGFILAALTAVDWTQIAQLNFADGISKGEMIEAAKFIALGVMFEITRRRTAK